MVEVAGLPPRDIALLVIFALMASAALIRPWLGVLALAFLSFFHPQGYAQGPVQGYPLVMTMFLITVGAMAKTIVFEQFRPRLAPLLDWRIVMMFTLFGWFVITTIYSINHWAAWPYLWEVLKILPAIGLMVMLIDTAGKLRALLFVLAISIALVTLKGSYWAIMTGFQDRVYGPPHSQFGDNNEFAVAMVMSLPLLFLMFRESTSGGFKAVMLGLIILTYVAVISTWSRGGLLALLAVTALLMVRRARNIVPLSVVSLMLVLVLAVVPEDWFTRMSTLVNYQHEGSALSRLAVWHIGLDFAAEHPVLGGGFRSWIYATLPMGGSMAWHSAYVQILTEHGYLGLSMFMALLLGTVVSGLMPSYRNRMTQRESPARRGNCQGTIALTLIAYGIGAAFLSIAYWELVYWLIALAAIDASWVRRDGRDAV